VDVAECEGAAGIDCVGEVISGAAQGHGGGAQGGVAVGTRTGGLQDHAGAAALDTRRAGGFAEIQSAAGTPGHAAEAAAIAGDAGFEKFGKSIAGRRVGNRGAACEVAAHADIAEIDRCGGSKCRRQAEDIQVHTLCGIVIDHTLVQGRRQRVAHTGKAAGPRAGEG